MFETIKLSDLDKRKCGVLRKSSSTRPTLWVVEDNGVRAVVKDFSTNGFVFRNTIGRFLIWRESKAYKRLSGISNIPTFYRAIDGLALVIEEVPGECVGRLAYGEKLPEDFFNKLRRLVENVHSRGIAHCDLKTSTNTLINNNGEPYVVDWAAAISERECRFFFLNLIYRRFLKDDYMGVVKLQLRHSPETVSQRERERLIHRSKLGKLMRDIRDTVRVILKKVA